jgi:exodeoxyribonuclease V beta subunit
MDRFEITGPLPGLGTTVLEASAGTGKTFAVAGLATRYVAEGVASLDELLVITFSRAATQELRDRVREKFVETAAALARPDARDDDGLVGVLTRGPEGTPLGDEEVALRRERLLEAVANYDAATIATTHEFCNAVLRSLGVAGDSDSRELLSEDISALADEVVDDRYLATYADLPQAPPIEVRQAQRVARAALDNRHALIRPLGLPPDSEGGALVSFAEQVRAEVEVRKRRAGIFTFDDMLSRLATQVEKPESSAAARMRLRWGVVLVDEFQDTDPVQWAVLRDAFSEHVRLVLIGDPKQAIYAFRGGDTPTYLHAIEGARMHTLGVNYRSDAAVVDALQVLTRGAQLGDERITVHPVTAHRNESSLRGLEGGVRLRQVRRDGFRLTKSGTINIGAVRDHVAADLAADIARTLNAGATIVHDGVERDLTPGDIAVLLHSVREEAPRIQHELRDRGIASVINAAESVMLSAAATHWLRLLEAMEKPQLPGRVRAAALTPFFDTTPEQLVAGGDDLTDQLAERIRSWLDLLRSRGVAAVHAAAQAAGLAPRVLAEPGGERVLTDLNHVGQVLHRAWQQERLGVAGLLVWLRDAIAEGNRTDSRRRRLDVDAKAVQFVTIHGAKGLEYPIVYLPQLFDRDVKEWATIHAYHDGPDRCLDVANTPRAKASARAEDAEEELRLAYVAMTRARAQLVLWWAPTWNGPNGPLTRLLFGRQRDEHVVPERAAYGESDIEVDAVLQRWSAQGAFRLESATIGDERAALPVTPLDLDCRSFDRTVDTIWRRTSYSGLIRAEEQLVSGVASEPERPGTVDEAEPPAEDVGAARGPEASETDPALVSPMDGLTAGATFGSLVHAVLEHADPQAADLRAELLRCVEEQRRWWSVPASSEELADALLPMQHTPLGPLAADLTLADLGRHDRLCELDFEIPMAGGDSGATPGRLLRDIGDALRRHLPADDPVRAYADRLDNPSLGDQVLRGYLSGSIDVVLRVPGDGAPGDRSPRYVVVDYKTNSLGEPDRPLTAMDYTPAKVTEAMLHSHYPLQALLYSVVVHRYLRWRQPGYDPERHLGGVLYLYVRGMVGPQTPVVDGVPCGVFSWRPPTALVEELSTILEGSTP